MRGQTVLLVAPINYGKSIVPKIFRFGLFGLEILTAISLSSAFTVSNKAFKCLLIDLSQEN